MADVGTVDGMLSKDLVVFQLSTVIDLRGLEFRIGGYRLTCGGCGQNLANYLSSLKRWIALSSYCSFVCTGGLF